jgi:hypothetical protein
VEGRALRIADRNSFELPSAEGIRYQEWKMPGAGTLISQGQAWRFLGSTNKMTAMVRGGNVFARPPFFLFQGPAFVPLL